MLTRLLTDPIQLGLAQAAVAAVLVLVVIWLARSRSVHIERDTLIALARGFVQIVVVGLVLVLVLKSPIWLAALVLAGMMAAAASIAARKAKDIPGAFTISLIGVASGAGLVIGIMTALGAIELSMSSLVPVGSMIIANAMKTNSLALDRLKAEVQMNEGRIEAGLALGASPQTIVAPYVQASIRAGLMPQADSIRSLGIVWIPGLMAGMILTGEDPIYAAIYQFVVMAMIFATAGLTSLITTLLLGTRLFSAAHQLLLRPDSAVPAR
jgi:putative ABC transport system permease protein